MLKCKIICWVDINESLTHQTLPVPQVQCNARICCRSPTYLKDTYFTKARTIILLFRKENHLHAKLTFRFKKKTICTLPYPIRWPDHIFQRLTSKTFTLTHWNTDKKNKYEVIKNQSYSHCIVQFVQLICQLAKLTAYNIARARHFCVKHLHFTLSQFALCMFFFVLKISQKKDVWTIIL